MPSPASFSVTEYCSELLDPFSWPSLNPHGIVPILEFNVIGITWFSCFVAVGYRLDVIGKASLVDTYHLCQCAFQGCNGGKGGTHIPFFI